MTQTKLAKKIGITPKWLSTLLHGKGQASYRVASALAKELKMPVEPWMKGQADTLLAYMHDYLLQHNPDKQQRNSPDNQRRRTLGQLAQAAGITNVHLSRIVNKRARTTWPTAKKLAAETGTDPQAWMDRDIDRLWPALETYQFGKNNEGEPDE